MLNNHAENLELYQNGVSLPGCQRFSEQEFHVIFYDIKYISIYHLGMSESSMCHRNGGC